ncbi:MAG TPA: leucyl/phenylalanyl-tRNA--protein transferase [Armatimonadota bacterium]|jgi:leucyl/phenylalanyl-tRNA--protein transferase
MMLETCAIPADHLLACYAQGLFPMADSASGPIRWYSADPRGIIDLEQFHVPRRLARGLRSHPFTITLNQEFESVVRHCGQRADTWISEGIIQSYLELHRLGYAHSVEARVEGELVGGLYGVALQAAFFGESMFHLAPNASKAALVALVGRLRERGYLLLDTQMVTPVTRQFGATEIPEAAYHRRLRQALRKRCRFA